MAATDDDGGCRLSQLTILIRKMPILTNPSELCSLIVAITEQYTLFGDSGLGVNTAKRILRLNSKCQILQNLP
jgi:hypothetical protein